MPVVMGVSRRFQSGKSDADHSLVTIYVNAGRFDLYVDDASYLIGTG